MQQIPDTKPHTPKIFRNMKRSPHDSCMDMHGDHTVKEINEPTGWYPMTFSQRAPNQGYIRRGARSVANMLVCLVGCRDGVL